MRVELAVGVGIFVCVLSACGGGGSSQEDSAQPSVSVQPSALDTELLDLAKSRLGLTGDPALPRGARQTLPDDDPLVKLGELLFFSQTLSANYDVSCATCHHPDFGTSDGLSLPVGVAAVEPTTVGPGREVDPARDLDPSADGGPNMHRNSLSTLNSGLLDRHLMYDGRIQVLDDAIVPGGHGQAIQTPDSGQRADIEEVDGLLEFTVKAPIVNDNEMRGYLYTQYATSAEYRDHLVRRLRGDVDAEYTPNSDGPANWLARFRAAFDQPAGDATSIITIENVQRALAAYVGSETFVDTPWRRYLKGNLSALTDSGKRGALLFFRTVEQGGLGCASCHSGDRFTDEEFHNLGFPQIGRGFRRDDHSDLGRWLATRVDADLQAFRTPSLLNVAVTGPYGHAGSFQTLTEAIRYHADPRRAVDYFDFGLGDLDQFRTATVTYDMAEAFTRSAIGRDNFASSEALLPRRPLGTAEENELEDFLASLTDSCVAKRSCIGRWTPQESEDPDGHMLVRDSGLDAPPNIDAPAATDYPAQISMAFPAMQARATFADVESCTDGLSTQENSAESRFEPRFDSSFGLNEAHGYSVETWFGRPSIVEVAMIGGGVSAAYVDDDCWADLIFTSGSVAGMIVYRNVSGAYFERADLIDGLAETEFTGAAIADLNGDFRREILLGNVKPGEVPILAQNGLGQYTKITALPMTRPTFGISFAPLDESSLPYFYLAHWSGGSGTSGGTSPALWKNDGASLFPWDNQANTTSATIAQHFNFTPKFADFTGDGVTDLVIASDFSTSAVLRNVGTKTSGPSFADDADRSVITDENGMGSALLDIDNDGRLEWFVTSIYENTGEPPAGNWGQSGNRLYRSNSTADVVSFEDITSVTGVRDGFWGWGACAADVDNDGFIDLFHANGFGYIPDDVVVDDDAALQQQRYASITTNFRQTPPRLFINDGDGTFTERASEWGIDLPSEGRGVICLDYDRDGDVDIALFDHSAGLQFFENKVGSGPGRHFINIRLVGRPPNTDAIGARVYVTADVGNGFGVQRQLRISEANSNFNSQNLPDLHFGVGQAAIADEIEIVWPDRSESFCSDVAVDQFLVIDQRDPNAACP